jgi:hypothetical protein
MKFPLIPWIACSAILCLFVEPVYAVIGGVFLSYAILLLIGFYLLRKKKRIKIEPTRATDTAPAVVTFTDKSAEIAMRFEGREYPVWIEINNNDMYVYHGISMVDPGINTLYGTVGEGFLVLKGGVEYRPVTPTDINFIADNIDTATFKTNLKKANERHEANTASK